MSHWAAGTVWCHTVFSVQRNQAGAEEVLSRPGLIAELASQTRLCARNLAARGTALAVRHQDETTGRWPGAWKDRL